MLHHAKYEFKHVVSGGAWYTDQDYDAEFVDVTKDNAYNSSQSSQDSENSVHYFFSFFNMNSLRF